MPKAASRSAKVLKPNPNPPDPETPRRPTRATAGRGGRVAQLKKTAHAIEDPPRTTDKHASSAALLNEPANLMAPTPYTRTRTGRKKVIQKHKDVDANVMQVDQANPQPAIIQSGARGRFGLQLQPPPASYVGTQSANDYERDRSKSVAPHQSRPRSGPQSSLARSRTPQASAQQLRDLFNGSLSEIESEPSETGDQEKWPRTIEDDDNRMLYSDGVNDAQLTERQDNHIDRPPSDHDSPMHNLDYDQDMVEDQQGGQVDEEEQAGHEEEENDQQGGQDQHEEWTEDDEEEKDQQDAHDDHGGHNSEDDGQRRSSQVHRSLGQRPFLSPARSRSDSGTLINDASRAMELQRRVAVRRGDELPGTDYNLLNRHHLVNRRRKAPSPTYLDDVRNAIHHADDRGSKRRRSGSSRKVRDGDTTDSIAVPKAHVAAADVPGSREGAPAAPRPREHAPAIPRPRENAPTVQRPRRENPAPRTHEDAPAVPRPPAAAASRPREVAAVVPRPPVAVAVVPRPPAAVAAVPRPPAAARICEDTAVAVPGLAQPRRGKYSKNPKGTVPPKPTTIGFYPRLWTQLLETAKAEVRLSLFETCPFPQAQTAVSGQCAEILFEIVVRYDAEGMDIEANYFPEYKMDMARLLYNDTQTFRSEIKKIVQELVPVAYELTAPDHITSPSARLQFIKDKATSLLQKSQYLKGKADELGRSSHFAHPALKSICRATFYRSSSKSLRNFPLFQSAVPNTALALVAAYAHCLLTMWKTHGCNNNQPLNTDTLEATYKKLLASIEHVSTHQYHGPKFQSMMAEWAACGLDGLIVQAHDEINNDEFGGDISDFEQPEDADNDADFDEM